MQALHMNISKVRHGMNVLDNRVMQKSIRKNGVTFRKTQKKPICNIGHAVQAVTNHAIKSNINTSENLDKLT